MTGTATCCACESPLRHPDGRANDAILRMLSNALDTPLSSLTIVLGAKSRIKILEVSGMSLDDIRRALMAT
jgi:uncharacterized protein YggU (UPF0235/DUF167 family)